MTHFKLSNGAALCGSELAEEFVSKPIPPACNKCVRILAAQASNAQRANVSSERVNAIK